MAYNNSRNPLRSLQKRLNDNILIRLKDGTEYKGKLKEYDNFMNVILTDASEFVNKEETSKFEEIFVRGNNVLFIIPDAE
jgi:small nuclear ribonucleoprotein